MTQITATDFAVAHKTGLSAKQDKKYFHATVTYVLEHFEIVRAAVEEELTAAAEAITAAAVAHELEVQALLATFDAGAAALLGGAS